MGWALQLRSVGRGSARNGAGTPCGGIPGCGTTRSPRSAASCGNRGVAELRLAAIVLLQSNVAVLEASDLTRIEGFVRDAGRRDLVDLLAVDVVGELLSRLRPPGSRCVPSSCSIAGQVRVASGCDGPPCWRRCVSCGRAAAIPSASSVASVPRRPSARPSSWPRPSRRSARPEFSASAPERPAARDRARAARTRRR